MGLRTRWIWTLLLAGLLWTPLAAFAQAPRSLDYQGYLSDAAGEPIDGIVRLTVGLYAEPAGGRPLWEDRFDADVVLGVFSIALGSAANPLDPLLFERPTWLGVVVDDEELQPRQRVTSVAVSLLAQEAETLEGRRASELDQSQHVSDTDNPHLVRFDQLSGVPVGFADGVDDDSGGDVTGVIVGLGMLGGGSEGEIPLSVDPAIVQRRVLAFCPAESSIRRINQNGGIECEGDSSATSECPAGQLLDGGGACVLPDAHDHVGQSWVAPGASPLGLSVEVSSSAAGSRAVAGRGALGARGYLGVQGASDFDGNAALDIPGLEVGVVGISNGTSAQDNVGVYALSTGTGVYARGSPLAAELDGDVEVLGSVRAERFFSTDPPVQRLSIGDGAWRPRFPGDEVRFDEVGSRGSYVPSVGFGTMMAPLHLPDGATVTRVRAITYDDGAPGGLSVQILRQNVMSGDVQALVNLTSSPPSPITDLAIDQTTSIANALVDNASYSYLVRVFGVWPGDDSLRIRQVLVEYTQPGAY